MKKKKTNNKTVKMPVQFRTAVETINRADIDEKNRTVEVSVSSEYPVKRWGDPVVFAL